MRDDHGARPAACAALRRHATTRSWCGTPCRTTHRRVLLTAAARHRRRSAAFRAGAWMMRRRRRSRQVATGERSARRADRLRLVPGRNRWPRPLLHEPRRRPQSESVSSVPGHRHGSGGRAACRGPRGVSIGRFDCPAAARGRARRKNHRRRRRRCPFRVVLAAAGAPHTSSSKPTGGPLSWAVGGRESSRRNRLGASPVRQAEGRVRRLPSRDPVRRPYGCVQARPRRALRSVALAGRRSSRPASTSIGLRPEIRRRPAMRSAFPVVGSWFAAFGVWCQGWGTTFCSMHGSRSSPAWMDQPSWSSPGTVR